MLYNLFPARHNQLSPDKVLFELGNDMAQQEYGTPFTIAGGIPKTVYVRPAKWEAGFRSGRSYTGATV